MSGKRGLYSGGDPHVPASLLKLWYRELHDPLIPAALYQECRRLLWRAPSGAGTGSAHARAKPALSSPISSGSCRYCARL
ncbi:hypothetical protein HPB49_009935 [Dermacentor silvarum]|uniref:Uncharacterized protein n=1 Tax=Dermacentor silvarum TaxID=543639 RepID=A0ACB8DIH1_DERSI|nr:hypothetical protein HPB49_009935 [Dermacentor silvarum]